MWSQNLQANVSFSRCYSCNQFAIWVVDELIYPEDTITIRPNEDMPHEVKLDFVEAASIVDQSPRGAVPRQRPNPNPPTPSQPPHPTARP